MASKATTNRQKSSEKVIAACTTHAAMVETEISKLYGEKIGSASKIMLEALATKLKEDEDAMVASDNNHETELRDDSGIRDKRDETAGALYETITTMRGQLTVICGPDYVKNIGIDGTTPTDPVVLSRMIDEVVANLKSIPAPDSLLPGYIYDPGSWSVPMEEKLVTLKELITQTANEQREAEGTLMKKRTAIAEYDQSFAHAANIASTFLKIAGEKELAKRVRPSTRKPGQTIDQANEEVVLETPLADQQVAG